jgi:hypothetical protein
MTSLKVDRPPRCISLYALLLQVHVVCFIKCAAEGARGAWLPKAFPQGCVQGTSAARHGKGTKPTLQACYPQRPPTGMHSLPLPMHTARARRPPYSKMMRRQQRSCGCSRPDGFQLRLQRQQSPRPIHQPRGAQSKTACWLRLQGPLEANTEISADSAASLQTTEQAF